MYLYKQIMSNLTQKQKKTKVTDLWNKRIKVRRMFHRMNAQNGRNKLKRP
jgi:hypothetical protein